MDFLAKPKETATTGEEGGMSVFGRTRTRIRDDLHTAQVLSDLQRAADKSAADKVAKDKAAADKAAEDAAKAALAATAKADADKKIADAAKAALDAANKATADKAAAEKAATDKAAADKAAIDHPVLTAVKTYFGSSLKWILGGVVVIVLVLMFTPRKK